MVNNQAFEIELCESIFFSFSLKWSIPAASYLQKASITPFVLLREDRQLQYHTVTAVLGMPYVNTTCGCFDDTSVCMDTLCCPCCQVGRQCNAVEGKADEHGCCMCLFASCFFPIMAICLRCRVSDRFSLEEGCCVSTCCGCCFPCCSVCMTGRELNYRGINPGGCCCKPKSMGSYY